MNAWEIAKASKRYDAELKLLAKGELGRYWLVSDGSLTFGIPERILIASGMISEGQSYIQPRRKTPTRMRMIRDFASWQLQSRAMIQSKHDERNRPQWYNEETGKFAPYSPEPPKDWN